MEFALRLLIGLPTNLGCVFISEMKIFRPWTKEKKGQTLVEYGLLISLIALVLISVLTLLGKRVYNTFNSAANAITSR